MGSGGRSRCIHATLEQEKNCFKKISGSISDSQYQEPMYKSAKDEKMRTKGFVRGRYGAGGNRVGILSERSYSGQADI